MNKETVLITGVAGLLGSRMAEYLLERGYNVIGVDDLSGGYKENIPDQVEFFEMDVLSDEISDIFEKYNPKRCLSLCSICC
jgi:UDP-glucose 4-epimerase